MHVCLCRYSFVFLYVRVCMCLHSVCIYLCVHVYAWERRTRLNKMQRRANTEVRFILLEFG